MLHYYLQLPKDYELPLESNTKVSFAIMKTAEDAFSPFSNYLSTSIKTLEQKEDIKAKWKKVASDDLIELKIDGFLYTIPKTTTIRLKNNETGTYVINGTIDKDFDEPFFYWINNQKKKIQISKDHFILSDKINLSSFESQIIEKASWAGEEVLLEPAWLQVKKNDEIQQNGTTYSIKSVNTHEIEISGILDHSPITYSDKIIDFEIVGKTNLTDSHTIIKEDTGRYIVYSSQKIKGYDHDNHLLNLLSKENLIFENGSRFDAECHEKMIFKVPDKNQVVDKKVFCNNIPFIIKPLKGNDKDRFWIQLEELEETDDDIPGFSPLKYFFDDDISIKDNAGNEYYTVQGNESEYKLILHEKGNRFRFCFPIGKELQVRVNTYQLRKQLEAVNTLQAMPVNEHANLIKLFEKREKVNWNQPDDTNTLEWIVLTDNQRSGSTEQRNFVKKALSTKDFAILEGPPGSGKTTVILELICQFVKQGKRIMLCGSTHVAIDNVLERLLEKRENDQTLIQHFNILPVRIGDENRINDDVKEFQIDNLLQTHQISQDLLLDASNLVCGTTIGILQHPHFKERKLYYRKKESKYKSKAPVVPVFDCLIIDESSKTTFQEFLIPALYAKKWILAGDTMQLSPFTDRDQIISNLENIRTRQFNKDNQLALFYLQQMINITKYAKNKFVLPVPEPVMIKFYQEYDKRKSSFENLVVQTFNPSQINRLELVASDIILIEEKLLEKNLNNLPETHAILRYEKWKSSEHAFKHNYWHERGNQFKWNMRGKKEFSDSFQIIEFMNNELKERSWAEEIAWRIDRQHQLRQIEDTKKTSGYTKAIKELMPLSIEEKDQKELEEKIHMIASIAFPSILESLIKGIPERFKQTHTTISDGFNESELKYRRTVLTYQHRMHPDISIYPREQFYKTEDALLDLELPEPIKNLRQWNYNQYSNRSIWIDVKGKTTRNFNMKETERLILELRKFKEFAIKNAHPEGKEWTVACLTFYKGQERKIREKLQRFTGKEAAFSNFGIKESGKKIHIKLHTVDKFQGHEADIVFLSMVQTRRDGFMDNPNRLNVAITRAKFQLVIIGDHSYFSQNSRSDDLKQLALKTPKHQ